MIMNEQLISFETAKLAKERGYFNGCMASYTHFHEDYVYDNDPEHPESHKKDQIDLDDRWFHKNLQLEDYSNEYFTVYEAPTQSLIQKWLRENNKILVETVAVDDWNHWIYSVTTEGAMCSFNQLPWNGEEYSSYEEALEHGLQEAIKLI